MYKKDFIREGNTVTFLHCNSCDGDFSDVEVYDINTCPSCNSKGTLTYEKYLDDKVCHICYDDLIDKDFYYASSSIETICTNCYDKLP